MFKALYSDDITLHLINEDNTQAVQTMLSGYADSEYILNELNTYYLPKYENGVRTEYGFYATVNDAIVGLSLLSLHSWQPHVGSTGADTLLHARGRGIAPRSKPHLFYLAFEILGLNRVETGCLKSNRASIRSIQKTPGFHFEGVARESGINALGEYEDQYVYAILRREWLELYDKSRVRVLY